MGTPGAAPDVDIDDALEVFTALEQPSTPLTASEVAEELDCTREAARQTLDRLSDRGTLATRETGAHDRVWWWPVSSRGDAADADPDERSEHAEFGDFVSAVEDYAIFALDPDGTVATWNDGARRIKGYEESEIVGEHFSTFYTEADADAGVPEENLAAAVADGRVEDEGWRVRADGSEFWANVVITAIRDDDGDLKGFTKVTRDMTERREYERRLQRQQKRTEKLVQTAPIPIAVQNAAGETVMANQRAQNALGLTESEIVEGPEDEDEWTVYDADGEPIDDHELPPARVRATGEPVYEEEIAIETPEGERTWFSINAAPFSGTEGSGTQVVLAGEDVTELKTRERELEAELSEVFGRVSDAFYALDDEYRFTHVNDHAAEVLQHSPEELLGTSIWDVFPDSRESTVSEEFRAALETQEPRNFVEYYEDIDRWLEFSIYPSETGLSVYFQDVTERKEREGDLARYETIVETMNDGVYVKDANGRFAMVNEAYAEMTGYDREALVGEHASIVVDEEAMAEAKESIDDGADSPVEATLETANGGSVPAEGTFASIGDGQEIGVVRDVSERKERERRLQERERQLSTLMDNVPGMVYRCRNEPGWPMEFVSEGCRDLTGYDPETLERDEVSYGGAIVHEEDRDDLWDHVQRGLDEDGTFLVTYRIVADDGDVRWVRERGRHVPEEGDGPDAIEGVIIDVTERKQLESELDQVFGRVTDAFFALDEDWEFTYVNEKAHGIINPEGEELVGKNVWEEFPDTIGSSFKDEYERAMYEQETVKFEEYYPEPLDAWYDVTAYPSDTGLSVYFRDVTEQKEAQRQLEAERDMFAEGPAVVFRWGTEASAGWPVEYVSDNVENVLGFTPEELTSADVYYSDLLLEEELDRIAGEVESAVESGADRFTHEPYRIETEDGDARWVKDTTKIVRNDAGEVDHFLGYLVDITERKEQEQELARYETIVETVNDGIYVVDEDRQFTMVNEAYAEMTGYDREELLGEDVSLVVDEPVRREAKELEEQIIDGAVEDPMIEAELETASGERIPSEATFSTLPTRDEEGGRRIGVARDITDRKEYERELERKERRYEAVFEDPNILVGLLEPDGTVLDINDTAMEYVDAELADIVGEQFAETPWWTGDDDVEADVREWVERAAAGEYVDFEADLTRSDGERYVLSGYFRPVTDDDGEVVSIIVSDRDITEQREYQRELERSEQRYRTLVENFPNGAVGLVDQDLRYQTVGGDPVDTESEGASDLEGKTIREAIDPAFADAVEPRYRAALEGESSTFEVEQDGTVAQMQTYPVRDDDGEVFAALGMSQDVTERVERERYLEDAKSRLEAATEAGAVGTWEWDIQEDEMVVNPSFAETYGLDPEATTEDISLDEFVEWIHEEDRERVERQIERTVEERGEYETEYRVRDADGELRWVVARGHVETDEDGTPTTFPGAVTDITQRREYQRRIEESERRYRTLVESFPGGAVGLFDEDLTYTAVGGELLEEADVPREERIGQSVREIYPEELADEVEPYFQAALEGETNTFETEFYDRHLLATALPVTDADDEVFAGMLVVQDVTERREAQRELRESEAKFRMIAENLEEIVWMAAPDAEEFVYLNPAFEDVWGIDREELYEEPLSFIDRVHPEDREHVEEEFTSLPEEDFDEEFRIVRPDGGIRWVHARGVQVTDEEGEMTRIVGIGEDVTEGVERERRLEDRAHQQQAVSDVGQFALENTDLDAIMDEAATRVAEVLGNDYCKVLDMDEAGEELLLRQGVGWRDGIVGSATVAAHEDDSQAGYTLESNEPVVVEDLESDDRFGGPELLTSHDISSGISTIIGSPEQPWGILGTHDTERRTFSEEDVNFVRSVANVLAGAIERHRYQRELEELVGQLEESNERLERFAYVASHDLQEPLRMISNYLQLLERRYSDELDSDAKEFIDFAVDGAERMREMIDDLLAYSRLDTEAGPFEPTDAGVAVDNVLDDLQLRIEETDAEITMEDLPTVVVDENQFEMLFQNLVSNAIKYSGDEPPRIDIGAERHEEEWVFRVTDEGIGMDPEHADGVFDVFERLHTHDEYPGTGIGLAMCKKIVRHHRGRIWVESEKGAGSTFYFTVPADGGELNETTLMTHRDDDPDAEGKRGNE